MTRFNDQQRYLVEFMGDIWVDCPKCGELGHVVTDGPYWRSSPKFACSSCAYVLRGRGSRWFGPGKGIAKSRCRVCGRWLQETLFHPNCDQKKTNLRCPGCKEVNEVEISWSFKIGSLPLEPSFGLSLRLQCDCLGHVLWAYNPKHLQYIDDYVSARVRLREPNANGSMASRLPKWIKSAKSRSRIGTAAKKLLRSVG